MREGLNEVTIDGSRGEGGGQILRTSLALSMITGRAMRMHDIRAGRAKPGLRRQHLACVQAAAALCGAEVTGASVGSQALTFVPPGPGAFVRDELLVDIGTAGSTSLVVQTVLVPAIVSGRGLRLTVIGGTHNPMAPPFEYLERVFVPQLRAMGADVALTLERHGFAVGGGAPGKQDWHDDVTPDRGQLTLVVGPGALRPIALVDAGPVVARRATVLLSRLPTHVADRELGVIRERLGFGAAECATREVRARATANLVTIEVERAAGRELVTQFGERGLRAELVAERACLELQAYLDADVPVGEHLADQLLLPLAVAGGGQFRAAPLSRHATTNIDTIRLFLDIPIAVEPDSDRSVRVTVGAAG